jgi:hypothetical protein
MRRERVSERGRDDPEPGAELPICPACGARNLLGDRFCAECGTLLASPAPVRNPGLVASSASAAAGVSPPATAPPASESTEEKPAWVLGARPPAVIGGGIALLVLAAALLAIGQIDDTGTIVMLSICLAPLGLLTLAIGIARQLAGTARRG